MREITRNKYLCVYTRMFSDKVDQPILFSNRKLQSCEKLQFEALMELNKLKFCPNPSLCTDAFCTV